MKRLLVVLGTRPEAIKLAPLIIKARQNPSFVLRVVSTGQHREMLDQVFTFFELKADADLQLMRPGQTPADILESSLRGIRREIRAFMPDWVITQGDTTTAASAGLIAFYERIPAAHIEAGLRTYDLNAPWPEEFNRRILALASNLHFAPTEHARAALISEKIEAHRVEVTGNTGIDALLMARDRLRDFNPELRKRWADLLTAPFILCTLHRRETFGTPLCEVLRGLLKLSQKTGLKVLFPVHPNPEVRRAVEEVLNASSEAAKLILCDPLNYSDFVYLMNQAYFIITDSGGVQEEGPSLGKPVLVARNSTERPEAMLGGSSICVGTREETIFSEALRLIEDHTHYKNMSQPRFLFGDGKATDRILERLM